MKKILFVLFVLIGCNKNSYPWFSGSLQDALNNNNEKKIIMLDFYTDW